MLDVHRFKRSRLEQRDFEFRAASGLVSLRDPAFDATAAAGEFRKVYQDPQSISEDNVAAPDDDFVLQRLASIQIVRLPFTTPFLGVRTSWGYEAVSLDEIRRLKNCLLRQSELSMVASDRALVRLCSNPMMRLWVMIDHLKALSSEAIGKENKLEKSLRDFAVSQGWDPLLIGKMPIVTASEPYPLIPRNLREKRAQICFGHPF